MSLRRVLAAFFMHAKDGEAQLEVYGSTTYAQSRLLMHSKLVSHKSTSISFTQEYLN